MHPQPRRCETDTYVSPTKPASGRCRTYINRLSAYLVSAPPGHYPVVKCQRNWVSYRLTAAFAKQFNKASGPRSHVAAVALASVASRFLAAFSSWSKGTSHTGHHIVTDRAPDWSR